MAITLKKNTKKRLVLLDAHALLHRAYHALPDFANSKGVPTGGLYGYISMILRIIGDFNPDYIVACYDLPQKTFRHEAYEAYKGTRAKTDESLVEQIKSSRMFCEKLGIPIYDTPGFEADDMLGTIVEQTKGDKDLEIIIATGDMDSLQLVDKKKVRVFTLKRGMNDTVIYDEDAVMERFGFHPEFLVDYKGLRGDPSDNIIGIPGIGEKTATELVVTFGTIELIYKKLKKDRKILLDAGIKERIVQLLEENEESAIFSKTLATIRRDAPIEFVLPEKTWKESCDLETVEPVLREFEFKSLVVRLREVISGGGAGGPPPGTKTSPTPEPSLPPSRQAQIALWLLDSEKTDPTTDDVLDFTHSKTLAEAEEKLLQEINTSGLDFVFNNIELPLVPILQEMQSYGILIDAEFLKKLSHELHQELEIAEKKIYDHVGHSFNINSPKQLGEILFGEMQIHLAVKGFKVKKTASGTYSTRESDLEKLAEVHPIVADIFEYRELQKLLSTYIDNLPAMLDDQSRLHPELIQTGTTTGRFASQNPNIQNIPVKSEMGKKIRNAFIAPKGSSLIAADYSQIELRSAAMLSGDETFLKTFREGLDVHASVASRVFGVPQNEVTPSMRRQAKVINFGILFGMGVTALQKNLGTNRADAQKFYDEYFKQLPKLAEYMEWSVTNAKKVGYTQTLFGRRRNFPALKSSIPFIRAMAERAASNAPIQGTTADIIKLAMIDVMRAIQDHKWSDKVHMIMQIHDELVFEVPDELVSSVEQVIKETMEGVLDRVPNTIPNQIPITVSIAHGKSWGEAKD